MKKRYLIIIPAFNEEKSIKDVIRSIQQECQDCDVVVINDGSKDLTAEKAEQCNETVITLPVNLGIGGAVQTGLMYANKMGYDVAIQLDADGQHKAEEVNKLLKAMESKEYDLVLGSRFIKKSDYPSTFMRRLGVQIFSFLINLVTGQRIHDSTSGFRAFGPEAISFLAENYPVDFPEPESLVILKKNGFQIKEVAVAMQERQGGESSVTRFKSVYFMISISIAILINAIKRPLIQEVVHD